MRILRTTIRLDEHLLADAKRCALETHRTLTAVIEDALREMLARQRVRHTLLPRVKIPVFKGGKGLQPGVNLDSNAALLDLMDETDGSFRC